MKQLIKEFVPPIVMKMFRKPIPLAPKMQVPEIYSSYEEALKLCTTSAYEEEELIEVILKKTQRFSGKIESDTIPLWDTAAFNLSSLINPIIEAKNNEINVLDFGGACGAHYFHFRNFLNKDLKLNWVVVETPTMVKYAKILENDELYFTDNFEEAVSRLGKVDLLHTSGTLQCVDDPQKYLDKILGCNATWILFNRLAFNTRDNDILTIHASRLSWNGIGELPEGYTDRWIRYPFRFLSEMKFLNKVETRYALKAKFSDQGGMFPVEGEDVVGYGLLCRNRSMDRN